MTPQLLTEAERDRRLLAFRDLPRALFTCCSACDGFDYCRGHKRSAMRCWPCFRDNRKATSS